MHKLPPLESIDAALIAAAWRADASEVNRLLAGGANPSARDPESTLTAVMIAAGTGSLAVYEALLQAGVDLYVTDGFGGSLLSKTCQGGNAEIARSLLERGINVESVSSVTGHTALVDAIWYKSPGVAEVLIEYGAGIDVLTRYGFSLVGHIALEMQVDSADSTPYQRIDAMVKARQLADLEATTAHTLMAAAASGDAAEVERLLLAGAEVDQRWPMLRGFNDGHTALIVAARDGHLAVVDVLLRYGADPNATEPTFVSVPLHKAVYFGRTEITERLTRAEGIKLNIQGAANGYTPLHDSLWHGYADCARVLLDAGARTDLIGHDGYYPLDMARIYLGPDHEITLRLEALPPFGG